MHRFWQHGVSLCLLGHDDVDAQGIPVSREELGHKKHHRCRLLVVSSQFLSAPGTKFSWPSKATSDGHVQLTRIASCSQNDMKFWVFLAPPGFLKVNRALRLTHSLSLTSPYNAVYINVRKASIIAKATDFAPWDTTISFQHVAWGEEDFLGWFASLFSRIEEGKAEYRLDDDAAAAMYRSAWKRMKEYLINILVTQQRFVGWRIQ